MALEIERKFLVTTDDYKIYESEIQKTYIKQGYFSDGVRVRLSSDNYEIENNKGFITFKSPNSGMIRNEFEYEIPFEDAKEIMKLCNGIIIEKYRHIVYFQENKWEIDEFLGDNEGLVIAEIEMESKDHKFKIPYWVGEEITYNKKYYNSDLSKTPYKDWDID